MEVSWNPRDESDLSWAQIGRMAADWERTGGAAVVELSRIKNVTRHVIELENGARFDRRTGKDTGRGKWYRNAVIRRADHPDVMDWVARRELGALRADLSRILAGSSIGAGRGPDGRVTVLRRIREANARIRETEEAVATLAAM